MEMYQKPIMKIVELEKVDVLTCSGCNSDMPHVASASWIDGYQQWSDGCYGDCTKSHVG